MGASCIRAAHTERRNTCVGAWFVRGRGIGQSGRGGREGGSRRGLAFPLIPSVRELSKGSSCFRKRTLVGRSIRSNALRRMTWIVHVVCRVEAGSRSTVTPLPTQSTPSIPAGGGGTIPSSGLDNLTHVSMLPLPGTSLDVLVPAISRGTSPVDLYCELRKKGNPTRSRPMTRIEDGRTSTAAERKPVALDDGAGHNST